MGALTLRSSLIEVRNLRIEALEAGDGATLLFLNSGMSSEPATEAIEAIAETFRVIAPAHPGFAGSARDRSMTSVDDLAYFYLDLLAERDLRDVLLVGVSFGAWIAADIAIKSTARLAGLVLANPLGIKVSGPETRDIGDIFAMTEDELNAALFADPALGKRDYRSLGDAAALAAAQSRESLARYGWSPYMHDPKLRDRLHRIDVPTLIVRGTEDGLTSADYTRQFCAAVPGAVIESIGGAGHLSHIECPREFAAKVEAFCGHLPLSVRTTQGAL